MANNNGKITAPVSIADVKAVLGSASNDIGTLCKHTNINKWAKYKPVKHPTVGIITEAQRTSVNHGLVPKQWTIPKLQGLTMSDIPSSRSWTYEKPIGTNTSPYRLTDFVNEPTQIPKNGYNHNAKPFVSGFPGAIQIYSSQLDNTEDFYINMNFKYGDESYAGVGDTGGIEINLNNLNLGTNITNGSWRIGVAMLIPADKKRVGGVAGTYDLVFFGGSEPIGSEFNARTMQPNINFSSEAIDMLNLALSQRFSFTCIPFLTNGLSYNSATKVFSLNTSGKHYFMPNGEQFGVTVLDAALQFRANVLSAQLWYNSSTKYTAQAGGIIGGTSGMPKPSKVSASQITIEVYINVTAMPYRTVLDMPVVSVGGASAPVGTSIIERASTQNGTYTKVDSIDSVGYYRIRANDGTALRNNPDVLNVLNRMPTYTGASGTSPYTAISISQRIGSTKYSAGANFYFRMTN